jgi:hypothetical protein
MTGVISRPCRGLVLESISIAVKGASRDLVRELKLVRTARPGRHDHGAEWLGQVDLAVLHCRILGPERIYRQRTGDGWR